MDRAQRREFKRKAEALMLKEANVTIKETWGPDGSVGRSVTLDESNPNDAQLLLQLLKLTPPNAAPGGANGQPQPNAQPDGQVTVDPAKNTKNAQPAEGDTAQTTPDAKATVDPAKNTKQGMKRRADEKFSIGTGLNFLNSMANPGMVLSRSSRSMATILWPLTTFSPKKQGTNTAICSPRTW